jgi:hypothetical protein
MWLENGVTAVWDVKFSLVLFFKSLFVQNCTKYYYIFYLFKIIPMYLDVDLEEHVLVYRTPFIQKNETHLSYITTPLIVTTHGNLID